MFYLELLLDMFVVILNGSVSYDMTSIVVAIQFCFTYDLVSV